MIAHGNDLDIQLGRCGLHLVVLITIAEDELGLGDLEQLLDGLLHVVDIQRVEGDAIEEASIDHSGHMRSVPGNNAHNVRLVHTQVAHIGGNALRVQEQLAAGQRRIFRGRDLEGYHRCYI